MCSFYACRSQKRKKIQLSYQYLFMLSGSAGAKAEHRTLMKLSPDQEIQMKQYSVYAVQCRTLRSVVIVLLQSQLFLLILISKKC